MSEKLPYTAPEMEIFGAPDSRRYDLGGKDSVDSTAFAYAEKKKPITNADRVRAMTDEELAEAFAGICPSVFGGHNECIIETATCKECWLDWLKSKAEEGE